MTAVWLYAIRCLAEGDQAALHAMNFGPNEVKALRELNLADLYRASGLQAHCLDVHLNREVYWSLLAHLRREREIEAIQRDLIEADAPLEMMRCLFGVGSREYTRLRQLLTVDPAIGRPPDLDEATSRALWQAWWKRTGSDPTGVLTPEDYLTLHQETGASMRAVWRLTRRWSEESETSFETIGPSTPKNNHYDAQRGSH